MTQDIAGNKQHVSSSFAQTVINDMGLPEHLLNELQVRLDKIHTDNTQEALDHDLVYAKGIVRGLEVGGVVPTSQCLSLLEAFENAYINREKHLRHAKE